MSTPTEVLDTSVVEEPATPAPEERTEEASNTPDENGEVEQKPVEKMLPEEGGDVATPEPETEPEAPAKEMQQLEMAVEDEKEVDTSELPANEKTTTESTEVTEAPQEEKMAAVEESNTPVEEEDEESRYKHLKVVLTLPEHDKVVPEEENGEEPTDEDKINTEDEKKVPDKAKDDKERDSDSGSGSVADNSSVDVNLSISSFLSKTKEPGSVSIQVTYTAHILENSFLFVKNFVWRLLQQTSHFLKYQKLCHYRCAALEDVNVNYFFQDTKRQKKTLKKTRKFIVDGVEVSVTTSKIVTDNDTKNEEMRFLRYSPVFIYIHSGCRFYANIVKMSFPQTLVYNQSV